MPVLRQTGEARRFCSPVACRSGWRRLWSDCADRTPTTDPSGIQPWQPRLRRPQQLWQWPRLLAGWVQTYSRAAALREAGATRSILQRVLSQGSRALPPRERLSTNAHPDHAIEPPRKRFRARRQQAHAAGCSRSFPRRHLQMCFGLGTTAQSRQAAMMKSCSSTEVHRLGQGATL